MSIKKLFLTLVGCCTFSGFPLAAQGQAVLPHTINPNWEQLSQDGLYLTEKAMVLMNMQQSQLALQHAQLATQLAPTYYEGWFVLGTLHVQQENWERGIAVLNKAKRLESQEAGIYFTLASAYFQQGEYKSAIAELQGGLALNDTSINAWFDLGNNYLMLRQDQEAIAAFETASNLDPSFWYAVNNIGLIYYEQGKLDQAIAQWEKSLAVDDGASEPMLAIAVALHRQGETRKALDLAQTALTLDRRYGDLTFLEENLWGETLLKDTATLFQNPSIKTLLPGE